MCAHTFELKLREQASKKNTWRKEEEKFSMSTFNEHPKAQWCFFNLFMNVQNYDCLSWKPQKSNFMLINCLLTYLPNNYEC